VQNCSNAVRICAKPIKEEYASRKLYGFPSMEGTPKNTFVWISEKSKPFHPKRFQKESHDTEDYAKEQRNLILQNHG
jgi:hypothetical protein